MNFVRESKQAVGSTGYREHGGAWIHETARLEDGVALDPGAVIGPDVRVGRGCRFGAGAVVYGPTELGPDNHVHAGAVIGGDPQDVGYRGEPTRLEIGSGNVFREGVTISRGSPKGNALTSIGNRNYFMAESHAGHDSVIADDCIFANAVLIAGHCAVHSGANFAGGAAIVQFTTVGRLAFLGGMAGGRQDLEPFLVHDCVQGGLRSVPIAVNKVGLRRAGIPEDSIERIRVAYKLLFRRKIRRIRPDEVRREVKRRGALSSEVEELLEFVERKHAGHFGRQLSI